jgi:hypothetical protein
MIDDVAPRWPECVFSAPHPSWKISLPMWMFAMQFEPDSCTEKQIVYLLKLALYRLRLHPDKVEDGQLREIFCEMASIYPLCMKYRLDHSGRRSIDQWVSLAAHPCPSRAGYDCEDGAELVLRMTRLIKSASSDHPLLKRVQESVRDYEFCMCIGTLQLEKSVTWHAYVMGFERDWLLQLDKTEKRMKRMPLMIESTDYLTSDLEFSSPFCNGPYFKASPLLDQAEEKGLQLKIPPPILVESKQYHHVAMAFTPQLIDEYGVPMVFFCEPDKMDTLGVTVFINMQDAQMVVPCRLAKDELKEVYDAAENMDLWIPRSRIMFGNSDRLDELSLLLQPDSAPSRYVYYSLDPQNHDSKKLFINDDWAIFVHSE